MTSPPVMLYVLALDCANPHAGEPMRASYGRRLVIACDNLHGMTIAPYINATREGDQTGTLTEWSAGVPDGAQR